MSTTEFARHPDLATLREQLSSNNTRAEDMMQRVNCVMRDSKAPGLISCSGNLNIGLFFDGTGNNEKRDYGPENNPFPLRQRKHSNIVRLYHAFPGDAESITAADTIDKYYRFYIPGVGTPFPEIKDTGNTLGSAAAWGGESRILWGLIQVINAIHRYYRQNDLLDIGAAGQLANQLANEITNVPDILNTPIDAISWPATWLANMLRHHTRRREKLGQLLTQVRAAIPPNAAPRIRQINLSVFGFSRGAAQSRAFVNWLLELCEDSSGKHTLADIPLNIQFMGLFDTVASVGIAGIYSFMEGRQGWAEDNLQIPGNPQTVRECVHMVAAHEVRACFPLDSVRVDHAYPKNTVEIVYPGAHSDVGGGYLPQALGKDDWDTQAMQPDLQLPRVSCFDMYCRAMRAGVPFYALDQLIARNQREVVEALLPATQTLDDLERYYALAQVSPGPVEDMVRAHMSHYHAWRWKTGVDGLDASPEIQRIQTSPNKGKDYEGEYTWVCHTQHALIQVVAAYCNEIDRRIQAEEGGHEPLNNTLRPLQSGWERAAAAISLLPLNPRVWSLGPKMLYGERKKWLTDKTLIQQAQALSRVAPQKLAQWRNWLENNFHPEWHDLDAELEAIWLLEALLTADRSDPQLGHFFARHVHDSMAGFIGFGMPEFELNGHGLGKFRRMYFGNAAERVLRERVSAENQARGDKIGARKAQYLELTTPPRVPPMGQWFPRL